MKALISIASRNRNRFLVCSALLVVLLLFANLLYDAVRYEFGYPYHSFMAGPDDRFADLIKVSLSFKKITSGLGASAAFQHWPPVFQSYYKDTSYGGIEKLDSGALTHFHHPPLSQLLFSVCAYLLTATASPRLVLSVWFGAYCLGLCWMAYGSVERSLRTRAFYVYVLFFGLLSYPALFLISRANYNAGFTAALITVFLLRCCGRRTLDTACLLSLAVAINIRPNATLFLAAIPFVVGWRSSAKPVLKALAMTAAVFVVCLAIEHQLDPDYTLGHFLRALHSYNRMYVTGGWGDPYNSSLFALAKNCFTLLGLQPKYVTVITIFAAITTVLLFPMRLAYRSREPVTVSFIFVSFYTLLTPVFADYHLLVFIAPLCLLYVNWDGLEANKTRYIIVLVSSALMLAPKNYVYLHSLSIQTVLNPLILVCALVLTWAHLYRESTCPLPLETEATRA